LFREGGFASAKQWRDIVGVLRVSEKTLDNSYLDAWAVRLNLSELLTRQEHSQSRAVETLRTVSL
jgi:hypothetical protein